MTLIDSYLFETDYVNVDIIVLFFILMRGISYELFCEAIFFCNNNLYIHDSSIDYITIVVTTISSELIFMTKNQEL